MAGNKRGSHAGGAMILVILVTLYLVVFSVLSYATAASEACAAGLTAGSAAGYYQAGAQAAVILAAIDAASAGAAGAPDIHQFLLQIQDTANGLGVELAEDGDAVRADYTVEISERSRLLVTLALPFRPDAGTRYHILRWQVETDQIGDANEVLPFPDI